MPEDEEEPGYTGTKLIAGAACGMILCYGLCRVGFYLDRNVHDGAPGTLDILGGVGFLLCAIALFGGILIAVLEQVHARKGRRPH